MAFETPLLDLAFDLVVSAVEKGAGIVKEAAGGTLSAIGEKVDAGMASMANMGESLTAMVTPNQGAASVEKSGPSIELAQDISPAAVAAPKIEAPVQPESTRFDAALSNGGIDVSSFQNLKFDVGSMGAENLNEFSAVGMGQGQMRSSGFEMGA